MVRPTNPAKKLSDDDGRRFLREALSLEQNVLRSKLELSKRSIVHDATLGEVNENHFIDVLRRYLPNRYCVDSGFVIDSFGHTSDQIDAIVFDRVYTPTLLDQYGHLFVPAEAVYGVFEVKPSFNKEYLNYAADKAASVRKLHRTSAEVSAITGSHRKDLFRIFAGLIAVNSKWKDAFGDTFKGHIATLQDDRRIDCGLALEDGAFDTFDSDGLHVVYGDTALASFLFRLLSKLQSLGTVPGVDWNAYGDVLST